jgi:hypothetical protein
VVLQHPQTIKGGKIEVPVTVSDQEAGSGMAHNLLFELLEPFVDHNCVSRVSHMRSLPKTLAHTVGRRYY